MYTTPYTVGIELEMGLDEARGIIEAELKEAGFGVLTEIDVRKTMREKLDVEFRPYVILGACNPQIAHQAFQEELEIGALLPCNVILYQNERGGTNVAIMDPMAALGLTRNSGLTSKAEQVKQMLVGTLERVQSKVAQ